MRYVDGLAEAARGVLAPEVERYFRQGAGDGLTAAEAVRAWDAWRLLPRVLQDVTEVEVGTTLLGTAVRSPFAVAPTTLQRAAHPDGELAMARAVAEAGSLMVLSSNAGSTFADVAATGVAWWLQMYLTADRTISVPVIERALEAGAGAVVLTADTPVVAAKEAGERSIWDVTDPGWLRVNFDPENDRPGAARRGAEKAKDLGPHDVAWLKERFGVPVVVKGVLHPLDARRCVEAGADAVWVSNHGGRQLDRALPTVEALGAVAETVGSDAEVYVDGGVRRGAHALVAGALGARACFLGRPPLWALAADGTAGVERLLAELTDELVEALRLVGTPTWDALEPGLLVGSGSVS